MSKHILLLIYTVFTSTATCNIVRNSEVNFCKLLRCFTIFTIPDF